jgi:hypothetical protein
MAQGALSFKYENQRGGTGMTALGGLPVYLDLAHVLGLSGSMDKHLGVRRGGQGWTDSQVVMSLVMLNLAGGDCVEDIRILENDEGFCRVLRRAQTAGLKRKERRELERRWRKEKLRTLPSPSAIFRYLAAFHDSGQEKLRKPGVAFIPANLHLDGFAKVNRDFLAFVQRNGPQGVATLDMDATLVETNKSEALFCYESFKSYQPLNTWWAEQGVLVHTEFRDGNVPAGFEQKRVLCEALRLLPEGVESVRMRSDTAAYQHDLLEYCEAGENERFGRIEFAVGCDVTKAFKKAVAEVSESDWRPLMKIVNGREMKTGREWAEVCFVPNAVCGKKQGLEYRYLATREVMAEQMEFPGMESARQLPFPSMVMAARRYKVFGIVTNMDWEGGELIRWLYKRCGKSEEAHSVMKEDLAGGKLPSGNFGENAAWWWIMVLALNLDAAMKRLVLGERWVSRRMKAVRFGLINLPAVVMERSRYLLIRLSKGNPLLGWLEQIRARIAVMAAAPG